MPTTPRIPELRLRRAGARWREGAPAYILDVFRHPAIDSFYILFGKEFAGWNEGFRDWEIAGLEVNSCPTNPAFGVSLWGTTPASTVAAYRYANRHRRIRWLDIPENVREHIIYRAGEGS